MSKYEITTKFFADTIRRKCLRRADGTWEHGDEATGPEYVAWASHWAAYINGETYQGLSFHATEEAARKAAGRLVARLEADDVWYDRCKAVAGSPSHAGWMELPRGTSAADFFVGQRVCIYSRGDARNGLVEKIGKTNVHVIYVTASTGAIWRKSGKFEDVAIQELGPDDEEM